MPKKLLIIISVSALILSVGIPIIAQYIPPFIESDYSGGASANRKLLTIKDNSSEIFAVDKEGDIFAVQTPVAWFKTVVDPQATALPAIGNNDTLTLASDGVVSILAEPTTRTITVSINPDTIAGPELKDRINLDNDGGISFHKAAPTANEVLFAVEAGATPTPVWRVDEDGDTFQTGSLNWGSGDYISSSPGLIYIYAAATPVTTFGGALIESQVNHEFEKDLIFASADNKVTQPQDSSGSGPLVWSGCFTPMSGTWNASGYWVFANSGGAQTIWIRLHVPAEMLGGTVVIDQVTVYFTNAITTYYVTDSYINHRSNTGTSTNVATNTTDYGTGGGAFGVPILSSDISRATYPGSLYAKIATTDSGLGDLILYGVTVQAHLE